MRYYFAFRYRKLQWIWIFFLAGALALTWFADKPGTPVSERIFELALMFILWSIFAGSFLLYLRSGGKRFRGSVGPHVYDIYDDGFTQSNANGKTELRIPGLLHVAETGSHFFIIGREGSGYVIPKRDLPSYDAIRGLQKLVAAK